MSAKPYELLNLADFWESRGDHEEAARLRRSAAELIAADQDPD